MKGHTLPDHDLFTMGKYWMNEQERRLALLKAALWYGVCWREEVAGFDSYIP